MIEQEVNHLVVDYDWLKKYLQEHCKCIWEFDIEFDYYNGFDNNDMYWRIESYSDWDLKVTIKKNIKKDDQLQIREEVTLDLKNIEWTEKLFWYLWLLYTHSKAKKRISYTNDIVRIDLDARYTTWFVDFLEARVEIESMDEQEIMRIWNSLSQYIKHE